MTRSALVFWGHNPAPNVARVIINHKGRRVITWEEIIAARRKLQAERLKRIRSVNRWLPYKLWVAYFNQTFYGGWHTFLENRDSRYWLNQGGGHLFFWSLMKLFPVCLPLGEPWSRIEQERWMIAFAHEFKRRTQDRKPLGVAIVWWDGHCDPRRDSPAKQRTSPPSDSPGGVLLPTAAGEVLQT
jgi:hypothetical protein